MHSKHLHSPPEIWRNHSPPDIFPSRGITYVHRNEQGQANGQGHSYFLQKQNNYLIPVSHPPPSDNPPAATDKLAAALSVSESLMRRTLILLFKVSPRYSLLSRGDLMMGGDTTLGPLDNDMLTFCFTPTLLYRCILRRKRKEGMLLFKLERGLIMKHVTRNMAECKLLLVSEKRQCALTNNITLLTINL